MDPKASVHPLQHSASQAHNASIQTFVKFNRLENAIRAIKTVLLKTTRSIKFNKEHNYDKC